VDELPADLQAANAGAVVAALVVAELLDLDVDQLAGTGALVAAGGLEP
jgi:hypothetical protein